MWMHKMLAAFQTPSGSHAISRQGLVPGMNQIDLLVSQCFQLSSFSVAQVDREKSRLDSKSSTLAGRNSGNPIINIFLVQKDRRQSQQHNGIVNSLPVYIMTCEYSFIWNKPRL